MDWDPRFGPGTQDPGPMTKYSLFCGNKNCGLKVIFVTIKIILCAKNVNA